MRYLNGDPCGDTGFVREAIVDFVCGDSDFDDYPLGRPVFKQERDSRCIYEFEWKTPEACPIQVIAGKNCKVTVPTTGQVIDLTPLSKVSQSFSDVFSHDYTVQICGALKDSCGDEPGPVGICQHASNDEYYSLGKPSSELRLTEDIVTLTLEGGTRYDEDAKCGKVPRTSQIEFRCEPCATGVTEPSLLKEERCSYYFVWFTALVCPPERSCKPGPSPSPSPSPGPGPSPSPTPSAGKGKKSNTAMIAGIAIVVVLVVIVGLVVMVRKRVLSCGRSNSYSVMSVNSFVGDDDFDDDDLEEP